MLAICCPSNRRKGFRNCNELREGRERVRGGHGVVIHGLSRQWRNFEYGVDSRVWRNRRAWRLRLYLTIRPIFIRTAWSRNPKMLRLRRKRR